MYNKYKIFEQVSGKQSSSNIALVNNLKTVA